jgi:ABC-type branched-subunit amino acid transport system ATPase component
MAGLRPTECDQLVAVFREINRGEGLTILLIEHVMRAVMALAGQIVVLHHGEVIARGTPEQVVRDPAVHECYPRRNGSLMLPSEPRLHHGDAGPSPTCPRCAEGRIVAIVGANGAARAAHPHHRRIEQPRSGK